MERAVRRSSLGMNLSDPPHRAELYPGGSFGEQVLTRCRFSCTA